MRRNKLIYVIPFALTTVFATAADDVQVIHSPKSVLTIYSYGGPAHSRTAPEVPAWTFKRATAPLTDVVAVPPLSTARGFTPTKSAPSATPPTKTSSMAHTNSLSGLPLSTGATAATASDGPQTVTVTWNPSPDQTVVGYKLYSGRSSRHYTVQEPLGDKTSAQVTVDQEAVYLAVSAYTAEGFESVLSEELVVRSDASAGGGSSTLAGDNR